MTAMSLNQRKTVIFEFQYQSRVNLRSSISESRLTYAPPNTIEEEFEIISPLDNPGSFFSTTYAWGKLRDLVNDGLDQLVTVRIQET